MPNVADNNRQRATDIATKKDVEHLTESVNGMRDEAREERREVRRVFESHGKRIADLETGQAVLTTKVAQGNRDNRLISGVAALGALIGGIFVQKP